MSQGTVRAALKSLEHEGLVDVYARLEAQTRLFLNMTDQFHHDLDALLAIHEPIALAIIEGDADRAYPLASRHSEHDGERLAAAIFEERA